MAYDSLEPIGGKRSDFQAGQICATLANVHRDPHKQPEAFEPSDFIRFGLQEDLEPLLEEDEPDDEPELEPWEQQLAVVKMLSAAGIGGPLQTSE